MAILITGGTGFIGVRVAKKLSDIGEETVIMDVSPQSTPLLKDIQDKVKVVAGDVRQFSAIVKTIRDFKIERIINLAYCLHPESERAPHLAIEINALGTTNVFEAARVFGIKRVVHVSSAAVYGRQEFFGERAVTEEDFLRPTTIYGANKRLNEFIASKYEEIYGVEIPCIRLSVVYGAGRVRGLTAFISQLVTNPAQGKPVFVPLRSKECSSLINVDDAAELLVRLCLAKTLRHRIYNSGGYTVSGKEVAEIGKKHFPDADIRFDENAPPLPYVYMVDGSRIAEEFNWRMIELETGLLGGRC